MILGIDATNIRTGGGLTHLKEILNEVDLSSLNFEKILVWSNQKTLDELPNNDWLIKMTHPWLNKSNILSFIYQILLLSNSAKKNKCNLIFVPGGSFLGSFRPIVSMSRNMLPFEKEERDRFGWKKRLKLSILKYLQSYTFKKSSGVIFLTGYAKDTIHSFKLKENGLKVCGLKRRKNKLLNYILLYFRVIPEIIESDFIYIFYPTSFKYVPFICRFFRKKYGLYVRGEEGLDDNISHWLYKNAYVIFTVSDCFTNSIRQITGKNIVHTIRPMIPLTEKDVVYDRVYKFSNCLSILFLARLEEDKGVSELLEAVSILSEKGYELKLNLVGSGGFINEAINLVKAYKIENIVSIKGMISDSKVIKKLYIESDLYILPTYHEGFPRTLYEAMIFGTPIITTFVGGIPTLMKNGYNCKEIQPKSVESIVEVLELVINNYDDMIRCSKNGTKTVLPIINSNRLKHVEHLNKTITS